MYVYSDLFTVVLPPFLRLHYVCTSKYGERERERKRERKREREEGRERESARARGFRGGRGSEGMPAASVHSFIQSIEMNVKEALSFSFSVTNTQFS